MSGLDVLGAGLSDSIIIVRVNKIDPVKLKQAAGATGGIKGAIASAALATTNRIPKAVLDVGLPIAAGVLKDQYGVDATITAADTYRPEARPSSEFWPGLIAGTVIGGSGLLIWRGLSRIFRRG